MKLFWAKANPPYWIAKKLGRAYNTIATEIRHANVKQIFRTAVSTFFSRPVRSFFFTTVSSFS